MMINSKFEPNRTAELGAPAVVDMLAAFSDVHGAASPTEAMRVACLELRHSVGEVEPPTALKPLLRALGIKKREALLATRGRLDATQHEYIVSVRRGMPWRSQRFTIAHEIGHVLILNSLVRYPQHLRILRTPAAWPEVERLCNFAAAELLIPADDLQVEFHRVGFSPSGLMSMYDRYLTSYPVMFYRFTDVLQSCSIILWRHHSRKPEERIALRVVQRFSSHESPWMPVGITVNYLSPDIVTTAYHQGSAFVDQLTVDLRGRVQHTWAAASTPPRRDPAGKGQFPIFHGLRVPDERKLAFEVALLLSTDYASIPHAIRNEHCVRIKHEYDGISQPHFEGFGA